MDRAEIGRISRHSGQRSRKDQRRPDGEMDGRRPRQDGQTRVVGGKLDGILWHATVFTREVLSGRVNHSEWCVTPHIAPSLISRGLLYGQTVEGGDKMPTQA